MSEAVAADDPNHSKVGPPDPIPEEWSAEPIGIDPQGKYCLIEAIKNVDLCHAPGPGDPDIPGRIPICEGADGNGARNCSSEDQTEAELRRLEQWRKDFPNKQWKNYEPLSKFLEDCVGNKKKPWTICKKEGEDKYGTPTTGPLEWVGKKFSEFASNALKEAATYIGNSVVWLLSEFATLFNENSTINLGDTGIAKFTLLMTSLSAVLAVFLLLIQFGKVAVSHNGGPAATALIGLAKWAVISSVYWGVAQTALTWSDAVSTWIIDKTFAGGTGDSPAAQAMQQKLGTLFGGLITGGGGAATAGGALIAGESVTASAVGVVIVVGIVCILIIAALWVEILMRQVGIMLILATMPITLAGQLSDSTSEWWPKARNAFISLVLMKPAIVACFAIGAFAMTEGQGVQNMLVGFVMFLAAALCWPALAKFMTFTTNGSGSATASGWLSSVGSSASSMTGGYRPDPSGAGSVGGGSGYTKALESENTTTAAAPSSAATAGGGTAKSAGRFGGRALGMAAFGLQVAAVGKDSLESGLGSTAANAGLDQGGGGGRHVVIPPRRQPSSVPAAIGAPTEAPDPAPRPSPAPRKEG
ncbi:hypothetical protein AB0N28_07095 [Streptomyces sp. NPDC051130]|uniref:hypothetical protein n=1 Tax=Streptomyces sp. NPDC051130 TaxID=3157223 RepID=UPI00342C9C07